MQFHNIKRAIGIALLPVVVLLLLTFGGLYVLLGTIEEKLTGEVNIFA